MAAFLGSDEFITGFVYGLLIALVLIVPCEYLADRWRKRDKS